MQQFTTVSQNGCWISRLGTFLHFLDGLLGFIANVPFGILKTASWNRRSKDTKDKRESQFLVDIRDLNHKV